MSLVWQPGPVNPVLGKQRQENYLKIKTSLGHTMSPDSEGQTATTYNSNLGMVTYTCSIDTWEIEAGR